MNTITLVDAYWLGFACGFVVTLVSVVGIINIDNRTNGRKGK